MTFPTDDPKSIDALQRIAHALESIARNLNTNFKTVAEKDAQRVAQKRQ